MGQRPSVGPVFSVPRLFMAMLRAAASRFARPAVAIVAATSFTASQSRCKESIAAHGERPYLHSEDWLTKAKGSSVRKAHLLYKQAAEMGDLEAMYRLAKDYLNGAGTVKDPIHAAELLKEASGKGHARATYTLAVLYRLGIGVEKDLKQANALLKKAADAGSVEVRGALHTPGQLHTSTKADIGRGRLSRHN